MSQDAKKLCRRYGLNYVETAQLRLRRRGCGQGFAYLDGNGRTIIDETVKARIKQLAIPPAWIDVCIAEDERAHIQAVGRDADGRLQYRYHPDWNNARSEAKAQRLLRLGSALPQLRDAVRKALSNPKLTRTKVIAAVVRLIDRALLRPGYEEYAKGSGARGASTLLKSDVSVEDNKVVVKFDGKGGKPVKRELKDKTLARILKKLSSLRGRRLFSAPDENGQARPVTAREVNAFLAEASGTDVTAKDFRTFKASAEALALLTENNGHEIEKLRKKAVIEAADKASEILVNTRTVARSSYIHPSVIKAYESGKLEASLFRGRLRTGLNRIESALIRFLERGPD
jgi:DNA topoisomerase-1